MDPAERKRRSREKMKENREVWEQQLAKEKERSRKRREKAKEVRQDDSAKELWKEKERLRKRKQREKKKASQAAKLESIKTSPLGSYKCKNTLRKAVLKLKKSMPESPRKQEAVVIELVKDVLPKVSLQMSHIHRVKKPRSDILSDEAVKNVKQFYDRDDISRAAPGRKDTISLKDESTGKRNHVAKRHMVMSVSEAYTLFKEEYLNLKVGKSKFFELRPKHIRPISEMPHNVCVCMYHANVQYLIEAVNKNVPDFPASSKQYLSEITCNIESEKCMSGDCLKCFGVHDIVKLNIDLSRRLTWKQWVKQDKVLQVTTISGTLQELLTELSKQTPKFKHHVYVKNQQAKHFEDTKKATSSTTVVLQVDFAENFAILSQDEIQSAHWSHPQTTLFTGCAWGSKGEEKHSYIILSNELTHDKFAVWTFLTKIINDLKTHYPELEKICIFTDGCAAQFKNRFTLSNICHAKSDWGVDVQWSFFASSHGKGAVDGVGATAKRMLWSAIMSRRATINNSWECYDYLKSKCIKSMHIFYVEIADIERETLQSRWELVPPIPYLQKQHHFEALSANCLSFSKTSSSITTSKKRVLINMTGKLNYNDVYSSDSDMDFSDQITQNDHFEMSESERAGGETDFEMSVSGKTRNEEDFEIIGRAKTGDGTDFEMSGSGKTRDEEDFEITGSAKTGDGTDFEMSGSGKTRDEEDFEITGSAKTGDGIEFEIAENGKTRDEEVEITGSAKTGDSTEFEMAGNGKTKDEEVFEITGSTKTGDGTEFEIAGNGKTKHDSKFEEAGSGEAEDEADFEMAGSGMTGDKTDFKINGSGKARDEAAFEVAGSGKTGDEGEFEVSGSRKAGDEAANLIRIGSYVLVRFISNKKVKKEYKYIAVCQGAVGEDSEVEVMFMKPIKTSAKGATFVMNENDSCHINTSQILKILEEPAVKTCGNRIYYEFTDGL